MYLLLSVLLALKAASAVEDENTVSIDGQPATGSVQFNYFSQEGKAAADLLLKYVTGLNDLWTDYLKSYRTSNNASLTLNQYNDLEKTVAGTGCSADLSVKNPQGTIDSAVKNCGAFAPQKDIDNLKYNITQSLIKIQTADIGLKTLSIACMSLRIPPDPSCVENKKNFINEINSAVSDDEKQNFSSLSKHAFSNLQQYLKSCVDVNTYDLVTELLGLIAYILDCKNN